MKFTHTVLTSRVMDVAEAMYKDITITEDQRQEIEYAAYVACMNEDTDAARLADFVRVLKNHHVSPEDISTAEETEANESEETEETKEEQTMNTNTKESFEIREIDTWNYGEDEGWTWNTSYHMGEMTTKAQDIRKAFTAWMKRHAGITFKSNRTLIEYTQSTHDQHRRID